MKILGIHGRASIVSSPNSLWAQRAVEIRSRGHTIYLPQFDESEDPRYEMWETEIEDIDIEQYDAILAVSHGCWVIARYIKENDLHIKRIVFCCPGRGVTSREHTGMLYDFLENNEMNLEKNIDEIYIIHWLEDQSVPYSEWEKFQKQIWWQLFELEWFWHNLNAEALTFTIDTLLWWKQ